MVRGELYLSERVLRYRLVLLTRSGIRPGQFRECEMFMRRR
jgi:hypothetical protein